MGGQSAGNWAEKQKVLGFRPRADMEGVLIVGGATCDPESDKADETRLLSFSLSSVSECEELQSIQF